MCAVRKWLAISESDADTPLAEATFPLPQCCLKTTLGSLKTSGDFPSFELVVNHGTSIAPGSGTYLMISLQNLNASHENTILATSIC